VEDNLPFRDLPDEDIIALINNGDVNVFHCLVERYQDNVASVVIGMLGNVQDAEDIGQEIFIRVYKSIKNFRFRSSFKTYVVRIAMNVCLDEMKKKKKRMVFAPAEEGYENPYPEKDGRDYEIHDSINKALQELDSPQRSVVILRIIEGYSTKETSAILKIPEGTVLSRLSRAQEKLRELLHHLLD
jgi:RNA polymerase sigma-70 factor (ECF subfamily)